ncbi:nuclear transport factor 2 family protein [Pseudonocardia sp.]|uniref:nuclear transport factor 2 family protein n=1 Tax=Pseudonocardia sp. TaxID=60912 RepID=UPI003D0B19CD
MSEQDADVVRSAYKAFNEQDIPALMAAFDPEIRWHQTGRSVLAGDYDGVEAVLQFFGRVGETSDGTFRADLQDVASGDGETIAHHVGRAEARGRTLEDHNVLVVRMAGGRMAEVWEHHRDPYEVDEFSGLRG